MLIALQWILGLGGLVLLAFGLLWDRPGWRGRAALRCRKCWFDLTGTPGADGVSRESPVVCGECGKRHRSRRQMWRTRRHRWPIAAALVVWLGAYTASVWEESRQHGWVRAVPSWALVGVHLMFDDPATPRYWPVNQRTKKPSPVKEQLLAELQRRIPSDTFRKPETLISRPLSWVIGQYEIGLLDEVHAGHAQTRYLYNLWDQNLLSAGQIETIRERAARDYVVYRNKWPADVPFRVRVEQPWTSWRFWNGWLLGPVDRPKGLSGDELRAWYRSELWMRSPRMAVDIELRSGENLVTDSVRTDFLQDHSATRSSPEPSIPWRDASTLIGDASGSFDARLIVPDDIDEWPVYPRLNGKLGGHVYENRYEYDVVATIDEAITPVSDSTYDAIVAQALKITLVHEPAVDPEWYAEGIVLECGVQIELDDYLKSRLPEMTIAFRCWFVHEGEGVASFRMTRGTRRTKWGWAGILPVTAHFNGDTVRVARVIESGEAWTLVIESDPELALTEFDFDHYWKGRVEIPSSEVTVRRGRVWFKR